jgi:hypothetical protein
LRWNSHGHHPGQTGGDQHANGRQRQGGPERDAKRARLGAHTAVQQDHRQRQVTHHVGERVVVKRDAADTIDAGQHTDGKENNQNRDAKA